ncbi:SIR2 family protein [Streptococcus zalophi]|uniref:SIR2 family protein n=1 Tax=Streptococcus zalophi TaxID=640031 RepID=UPI00215BECD5|nr:SIR2 family protein [Streptococcus zalophi]MCR8967830.1 SIR2 family protein [Streptococcus zalophi]
MNEDYISETRQLIKAINEDSLIMFVGAGVSKNSDLPTWGELIEAFRFELNISDNHPDSQDYTRIAQYYYDKFGQNLYMKKIEEVFSSKSSPSPNDLHKLIEKIAPKHIITTNYDSLLEEQFENGFLKYSVVAEDKDIPYSKSEKYLIKMHGDFRKKNIVLKEDDYLDYHLKFPMVSTLVKSLIMNHTLLFVGYSLRDSTFNSIFRLIQNSFELDAKIAFFYTPENPSELVKDYYKKKGIIIVSNEDSNYDLTENSSSKNDKNNKFFLKTKMFLENLTSKKNQQVKSAEDLWNQLSFLDYLSFIDYSDFSKYSKLTKVTINKYGRFEWFKMEVFSIREHTKLINLLQNKTLFQKFLDLSIENKKNIVNNHYLNYAYKLYKERKYSLAKAKFRELANESYHRKDYFTFLLCEFNFKHIHEDFLSDEKNYNYQEAIFSEDLSDLTYQMIDSTSGNEKKILEYFRDVILNMNFLYNKLEKINDLFNRVRAENSLYKRGGSSWNNYLFESEFEIKNLLNFIDLNCICISQYKIYESIINRYLEILLLSYDNSKIRSINQDCFPNETSSVLKELELEDLQIILPTVDLKVVNTYLQNYSFSKIKITAEARSFLYEKITKFQKENLKQNLYEYKKLLNFLSIIDYNDLSEIIEILDKHNLYEYELYNDFSIEIKRVLNILLANKKLIDKTSNKDKLVDIIERHINIIVEKNLNSHYSNYKAYQKLLELCSSKGHKIVLSIETLEIDILKLQYQKEDISKIINYVDLFICFFDYFNNEVKESIIKIFESYEKIESEEQNYYKIVEIMIEGIYSFPKIHDRVYCFLVNKINEENDVVKTFPDPVKRSLSQLFHLKNNGFFKEKNPINDIERDIKGIFPEIDWLWFGDKSENVMEKLFRNGQLKYIQKQFAITTNEKERLNNFVIKMFNEDKLEFKKDKKIK